MTRFCFSTAALVFVALFLPSSGTPAQQPAKAAGLRIPVEYQRLGNGLRVVLSRDTTAPTAVVAVYYNIGFRNEPRERTGFAHLFEHMMFQGSQNLGKMEFIKLVEKNGGLLNGSTRFDFTNYYQVIPSHVLETVLWAEADRMRGLQIDSVNLKNQQEVVKNEVKVNVLNQPYGGFPWIDMPMAANTNWYNAHNFYGDLAHLDAATVSDSRHTMPRTMPRSSSSATSIRAGPWRGFTATSTQFPRHRSRRSRTSPSRARPPSVAPVAPTHWRRVQRLASRIMCRRGSRRNGSRSVCSTRSSVRATTAGSTTSWCDRGP
jgi:hypothetical protein